MYRSPSPIFDTPEVLALRRMKPLPKRRRTSSESSHDDVSPPELPPEPDTTDISSADALSAQLALQSYYMPVLGGMQELFKTNSDAQTPFTLDFEGLRSGGRGQEDADDGGDGDYVDHIQQPGNTKKRKVPANLSAMGHGSEQGDGSEGGEEETADRAIPTGRPEHEYDSGGVGYTQGHSTTSTGDPRRLKISRATLAGLSHKEMLKSRKRQLATVLGALTHGDTLALDQALSANYPFASSGVAADLQSRDLIHVRLSRRPVSRLARAYKAWRSSLAEESPRSPFPECEFTFVFHSASEWLNFLGVVGPFSVPHSIRPPCRHEGRSCCTTRSFRAGVAAAGCTSSGSGQADRRSAEQRSCGQAFCEAGSLSQRSERCRGETGQHGSDPCWLCPRQDG